MEYKAVIILSSDLPTGLQANIAAILGMSLGYHKPELIGKVVKTSDKKEIKGITTIPVPILTSEDSYLQEVFLATANFELSIPFGSAAITTKNYEDYENKINELGSIEQGVKGLLLYDNKKNVNKVTGQLTLLR